MRWKGESFVQVSIYNSFHCSGRCDTVKRFSKCGLHFTPSRERQPTMTREMNTESERAWVRYASVTSVTVLCGNNSKSNIKPIIGGLWSCKSDSSIIVVVTLSWLWVEKYYESITHMSVRSIWELLVYYALEYIQFYTKFGVSISIVLNYHFLLIKYKWLLHSNL